jgi:hypothetical protein
MASGEQQASVRKPTLYHNVDPKPFTTGIPSPFTTVSNSSNTVQVGWLVNNEPCHTPIQLNTNDTAFPIIRLRRYNDNSPEEMMLFFDETTRGAYEFLESATQKLKEIMAGDAGLIMHDMTDAAWNKKSEMQRTGIVESRYKDFFLPEREGQEFRCASFVVHPKANFYDEHGELTSKASFKANYTESDQANEYTYKVVVDISHVTCTKQKNLKVKAFVVAAQPVHDPNRKKAQEYEQEAPEVWVEMADEPPAKAQKK